MSKRSDELLKLLRDEGSGSLCRRAADVIEELRYALEDVRELIDGYVDIVDGPEGKQLPNAAMRAMQLIDVVLGDE